LADGLHVSVADGVLRLVLDRPHVYNALTGEMSDALAAEIEGAVSRDDVRVVLLTGRGAAFSTGADVSGGSGDFDVTALDRANRMVRAIVSLDKPVVAGVNGVAAGVGASLVFASDLAVAAESASFLLAFARVGLMPDGGATATVAAAVGRARALRMALLAEPLSASDALAHGLIAEVVPDADFADALERVVRRLAAGPPLAYAATKRAVNAATLAHLDAALERERTGQTVLLRTGDAAEGMRAFGEKRPPSFSGE